MGIWVELYKYQKGPAEKGAMRYVDEEDYDFLFDSERINKDSELYPEEYCLWCFKCDSSYLGADYILNNTIGEIDNSAVERMKEGMDSKSGKLALQTFDSLMTFLGYECVLKRGKEKDSWWIFDFNNSCVAETECYVIPDWEKSLERAKQVQEEFKKYLSVKTNKKKIKGEIKYKNIFGDYQHEEIWVHKARKQLDVIVEGLEWVLKQQEIERYFFYWG